MNNVPKLASYGVELPQRQRQQQQPPWHDDDDDDSNDCKDDDDYCQCSNEDDDWDDVYLVHVVHCVADRQSYFDIEVDWTNYFDDTNEAENGVALEVMCH